VRREELHEARLRLLHARIARLEAPPEPRSSPKSASGSRQPIQTEIGMPESGLEIAA
jgi:hypothetical protein